MESYSFFIYFLLKQYIKNEYKGYYLQLLYNLGRLG